MATKKFRCKVCGYIHEGDKAPDVCPVCQAPASEFEEITEPGEGKKKKGVNTNGNSYTLIYMTVIIVIVSLLLSVVSGILKERQNKNVRLDTMKQIQLEQKLLSSVEQALDGQEFQLFIQFYADAKSLEIVGGEALSRWLHPEQGLLPPGVFVPLLEQEGLTYRLDYHCLRCSCEFLQRMADRNIKDFFLSCNFSRETFSSPDFVERCTEIVGNYSFPRELLILELTESVLVKDLSTIRANMLALKEYGLRIALDDFGEGFSSFSDLQECPVDGIKLDKKLVDNMSTSIGGSILRAMIQIGHELGLTILAEGVETPAQAQALKELNCDVIQGFHFSAPLPQAEAEEKLLKEKKCLPLP